MKTITFYYVLTANKTFFVNTDSEEKAIKIVADERGLEPLGSGIVQLYPNWSTDIEDIFM